MKKLQEIIRVIGRKRLKKIEVFNESGSQRNNLYYKLYRGIKDGKFTTDEEAAAALFGCSPSDKKYLMLKSRVKARLINSLFFLESTTSELSQAIYKVNRNFVAAKFLLLNGAKDIGITMMKSTLKISEKYSITEITVECLRILRYQSAFQGREKDFRNYDERLKMKLKVYQGELRAEEFLALLSLPFAKSNQRKFEMKGEAYRYLEELDEIRKEATSLNLEMLYFRLRIIVLQIGMDYGGVIETCKRGEIFLDQHPQVAMSIRYGEFAFYRMLAFMHLGSYEDGKNLAARSLYLYKEGSVNWMIFLEYYFLLCMHTHNYKKAAQIHQQVVAHPRFSHLDKNRTEKWLIFEGFLKYMTQNLTIEGQATSRFNIFKFLNEVPIYSKDKRGLNIAILILQVLFLLDRQDYDGIISRGEALKVYCSRYLKRDEHFRSNCFLKMVLIMEKKGFQKEQTRQIADKYYTKLKSSRFSYESGNLNTLEIIPYEQLWQTILSKLKA